MIRRIITWTVVIFAAYYLITDPSGASHAVHSALHGLRSWGASLSRFVSGL